MYCLFLALHVELTTFSKNLFFKFNYLFERERESVRLSAQVGEGREKERQNLNHNRIHAISAEPHVGLELMNCEIMT